MKEILANELNLLFENTDLKGICTYKGSRYEVWEVSDEDYKKMCDMSEDDFTKLCSSGWWRCSEGSVFGYTDTTKIINGHKIKAWTGTMGYKDTKYESISDYLCNCIGASTGKNVCACAIDLAKYNNMTMAELFQKYGE